MISAVAVFVDTESLLVFAPGELKPVIEHAEGAGCGRLAERVVTVAFNNLAGKARQICDATKTILLEEVALTVRQDLIIRSQQDFINPLAVQVPARARPVGSPFVNRMRAIVGVIDRRSVQGAFHTTAEGVVAEIVALAIG